MVIVELYNDLLNEIQILSWLHGDLLRQLQRNHSEVWGHSMPLDKSLAKYDNIIERMRNVELEIEHKKEFKNKIDERLKQLQGMEYIVFHSRIVEGKSLQQIASENNCSYSYISKVSMKLNSEKSVKDTVAK